MPAVSTPPTIVGGAVAGKALAAVPGTWSGGKPVTFAYQWQSCDAAGANCQQIPGATSEKYVPNAADVGHGLSVVVSAQSAAGLASAVSGPTAAVAAAGTAPAVRPAALTAPAVQGTLQAGQVLTGDVGTWSGAPSTFAYQWTRCSGAGAACTAIAGATGSTYTLTPGDIGATLTLTVTATGVGGCRLRDGRPDAARGRRAGAGAGRRLADGDRGRRRRRADRRRARDADVAARCGSRPA